MSHLKWVDNQVFTTFWCEYDVTKFLKAQYVIFAARDQNKGAICKATKHAGREWNLIADHGGAAYFWLIFFTFFLFQQKNESDIIGW